MYSVSGAVRVAKVSIACGVTCAGSGRLRAESYDIYLYIYIYIYI